MILSFIKWFVLFFLDLKSVPEAAGLSPMLDTQYWRCVLKQRTSCPDNDINFYLYRPESPFKAEVDVRTPGSLQRAGWNATKKNVIVVHGFNGTEGKVPMKYIRDAYLSRGDYNVFTVDWSLLTAFPCYLSALSNMRLVAQCSAQLYSHLTQQGAMARMTTCVGHSLGAHICGMMSNHLSEKQYKIVGLDPARPLVSAYGSREFRLTRSDAQTVHVVHSNAGFLGERGLVGHADFCINGGRTQPSCRGHQIRRARCSHFQSVCFFAASVRRRLRPVGVPCEAACPKQPGRWGLSRDRRAVFLGAETPDTARGMYCVKIDYNETCPFD